MSASAEARRAMIDFEWENHSPIACRPAVVDGIKENYLMLMPKKVKYASNSAAACAARRGAVPMSQFGDYG